MNLADKLLVVAEWLEASDNELLVEATEEQLDDIALAFVEAADVLRTTAQNLDADETSETSAEPAAELTSMELETIAALADKFDASGDDTLMRQASVLDDILCGMAAPRNYVFNFKRAQEAKLDVLKQKYKDVKQELDEDVGRKEAVEALKDSPMYQAPKEGRPLQYSLDTRTCLDHPGAQMARIGEREFQCSLDHKIYRYDGTGYTLLDGTKIPGTSVTEQTPKYHNNAHQIFDDRDGRLGLNR